jgi:hypothetical protein
MTRIDAQPPLTAPPLTEAEAKQLAELEAKATKAVVAGKDAGAAAAWKAQIKLLEDKEGVKNALALGTTYRGVEKQIRDIEAFAEPPAALRKRLKELAPDMGPCPRAGHHARPRLQPAVGRGSCPARCASDPS